MIEFDKVSKVYPSGAAAVRDLSLQIPSHAMIALVGSSGSGKTTLLRMVNRMVAPTGGRVLIDGRDIRTMEPTSLRRSIGYVLQGGGLLPHRTVVDNVATVPVLNGRSRVSARRDALGLLERVGLDRALAGRYPAQLSGGQQQRVGVARALAADPNILLMDEPFGAVDPIVRRELQDEVRRLHRELGKTIVFVTHDVDEAFALGDEVVLLRAGGEVAQRGTPAQLLTQPADAYVAEFVGAADPSRALSVREVNGVRLVVDRTGRFLGALAP
ncbi:ATP-binding cassette domain-containing protein [Cryobacterium sp. SO2]|uniref:ABC transporter ATP-binding protein n=1 Tax=Cryobacterium sp. SO2 TaxID=1897060 RepID=UPI00223DFC29|nr:ATP-binding cassette domain-containing protein [Cryobacterium sp. SO2]WEO75970.1 ATP-binding cassette domain-containing protein [Cryobacterium sp. SO2]